MKKARLIMCSEANNNKYYYMDENTNGTFTAKWGRIDVTESSQTYPMAQWDKKYKEKTKKGYVDRTDILLVKADTVVSGGSSKNNIQTLHTASSGSYKDIENSLVRDFIRDLLNFAKQTVEENYKVSGAQVTEAQLTAAQSLVNDLVKLSKSTKPDLKVFNKTLLELYTIIPRRMGNVKSHLAKIETKAEFGQYVTNEQSLLDTMQGEYDLYIKQQEQKQKEAEAAAKQSTSGIVLPASTILDAHFLLANPVEDGKIIDKIRKLMGDNKDQFVAAYAVVNQKTQTSFDKYFKTLKTPYKELLWHGSRNENWWSIITKGLLIRPSNAVYSGSMFGDAIYGANKARKSIGYTSYRGSYWARGTAEKAYLALFEFALGNQMKILHHKPEHYRLNQTTVKAAGFDSVYAQGGADLINDEFMVYTPDAATIKYIVEIK